MTPEEINNTGTVRQIIAGNIPFSEKLKAIEKVHRIINNNEAGYFDGRSTEDVNTFCLWSSTKENHMYWQNLYDAVRGRRYEARFIRMG
jgi:hypothetical protein